MSELDRLQELKTKGWPRLSGEEREEYQQLKDKYPPAVAEESAPAQEVVKPADDTITIRKSELEDFVRIAVQKQTSELRSSQQALEEQIGLGTWKEWKAPIQKNKTATLRKWRKDADHPFGLVIDWSWHHNEYKDVPFGSGFVQSISKQIYKLTVLYPNSQREEVMAPLEEFARIKDIETIEILKQDLTKMSMSQGRVRAVPLNKEGYRDQTASRENMPEVELEVMQDKVICTVKTKTGQEFIINADRLNA